VSSLASTIAPRSVDVLPSRVPRRVTRRDGLLPFVLTCELLTGFVFGLAAHSGDVSATSTPARVTLEPVAMVTVAPPAPSPSTPTYRRTTPVDPFAAPVVGPPSS
jgi:hypothetical protein